MTQKMKVFFGVKSGYLQNYQMFSTALPVFSDLTSGSLVHACKRIDSGTNCIAGLNTFTAPGRRSRRQLCH